MTTAVAMKEKPTVHDLDPATLAKLVLEGDCKNLTDEQRVAFYRARCDAAGLDYRAQPFEFLTLNNKLVLYAKREAANQLAANHGIRCEITDQRTEQEMRVVTVRAVTQDGRQTDEIGVVNVANVKGDNLANAYMKAVTKAKRRAVLSVCGLGMLDETELETIPGVATPRSGTPPPIQAPRRRDKVEAAVVTDDRDAHGPVAVVSPLSSPHHPLDGALPVEETRLFTDAELKSLFGVLKKNGKDPEAFKQWAIATLGVTSRKELRLGHLEQITAWMGGS